MSPENRSLMMRANRLFGAGLVEHNLVKLEDLEKANERLLEIIAANQPRQATVLGVLAYELKVVKEEDVLQHLVESEGLGLVDLRGYEPPDDIKKGLDLDACWATWSVPFDLEEDFMFIASAYYLSPAVRTYWEKRFEGPILWFGTTLEGIAEHLDRLSSPTSSKAPFPTAGAPAAAPAAPISQASSPAPAPAVPAVR
ncbi:MAG TPA: hypothetical protein VN877_02730, partial [Opitutaceae bacterium]|nr:hypothetical protein [Opitutaceae bacterium]